LLTGRPRVRGASSHLSIISANIAYIFGVASRGGETSVGSGWNLGPNLAKTKILAKYNTVNQVDRLHGGTPPAHAVREKGERERFAVT
jgi:hypothetical protein